MTRPKRTSPGPAGAAKRPFDIEAAMPLLREAVAPYPKAALFELYAEGHTSVFEILVACILSIRTRDATTLPVAVALFSAAPASHDLAPICLELIARLIA